MPPKRSQNASKRAASPAELDNQPIGKRTRARAGKLTTEQPPAPPAPPVPRARPKMRPVPPTSSDVEILDEPVPASSKKKAAKSGLNLSSVGGKPVSNATPKASKARPCIPDKEDSEYGEEEIDELKDDVDVMEPPCSTPAPTVKKITLRITSSSQNSVAGSQASSKSSPDSPEPEPTVETAKFAFSVEKDGVVSRPIRIPINIDYETFTFRAAQAFGEVAGQQDLIWKTDRMPKSAKWGDLEDENDFTRIKGLASSALSEERDKFCATTTANNEGRRKASLKGKVFTPKNVQPLVDFVVLLRDRNQERKIKEAKSSKKARTLFIKEEKKPAKTEKSGRSEGLADRILACKKVIEGRECPICHKCCVILPGSKGSPAATHKELSKGEIQAWAHAAALAEQKGEKISLETPPDDLLLQWSDYKSGPRGKKSEGSGPKQETNQAPTPHDNAAVPPLAPPPPPQPYYPPHPYGHYPPYPYPYPPPPPPHYGGPPAYGYPPLGHGNHGAPAHVTNQTLLSEWLVMCDRGERGENSDNFSGLIAGFSAQKLFRLADIHHKPIDFFTQIDFPTFPGGPTFQMPLGTASRLCQYLSKDLP